MKTNYTSTDYALGSISGGNSSSSSLGASSLLNPLSSSSSGGFGSSVLYTPGSNNVSSPTYNNDMLDKNNAAMKEMNDGISKLVQGVSTTLQTPMAQDCIAGSITGRNIGVPVCAINPATYYPCVTGTGVAGCIGTVIGKAIDGKY
jgi:hypothetical protein